MAKSMITIHQKNEMKYQKHLTISLKKMEKTLLTQVKKLNLHIIYKIH